MRLSHYAIAVVITGAMCRPDAAAAVKGVNHHDEEYFSTPEATRVGEQVMLYQRVTGGWPKNIDMERYLTSAERHTVLADKQRRNDSTTDNGATVTQLSFLARLYKATGDSTVRASMCRGIEYLISGQYDNGGWPQFWPDMRGYQVHITYNDNAMVNTLETLRRVAHRLSPYSSDIVPDSLRAKAEASFNRGIECILHTQITDSLGHRTIWCQQHDRNTLKPTGARSFELAGYCPVESAAIVALLMRVDNPSAQVCGAVHAAMRWLDDHKITGKRFVRIRPAGPGRRDAYLADDPEAPALWARYYDLQECRPFVCDRDGVMKRNLADIGVERRTNYAWYATEPGLLFDEYAGWCRRHNTFPER